MYSDVGTNEIKTPVEAAKQALTASGGRSPAQPSNERAVARLCSFSTPDAVIMRLVNRALMERFAGFGLTGGAGLVFQ